MDVVDKVQVGDATCGRGVFAARTLRKGSLIGVIEGKVFDDPGHSSDYCIDLGGTLSLEPDAPFRFLNHSCEPNCQMYLIDPKPRSRKHTLPYIQLYALKRLTPGEELTIDYAWSNDRPIRCLCGTPSCRGWIMALPSSDPQEVGELQATK